MNKINEVQRPTNIMLSVAQKFVLTKLMLPEAESTLIAYKRVSTGRNIVAARDVLIKQGMLIVGANEAQITEKGQEALKNENLIDDMGTLTPQGEEYAYAEDLEAAEKIMASPKQPEMPALGQEAEVEPPKPMGNTSQDTQSGMAESWSMISTAQADLNELGFIKSHSKKSKKS